MAENMAPLIVKLEAPRFHNFGFGGLSRVIAKLKSGGYRKVSPLTILHSRKMWICRISFPVCPQGRFIFSDHRFRGVPIWRGAL